MTFRCYRIQRADRDPQDLLDPASWQSRAWVGTVYRTCPDCHGTGNAVVDGELATCGTCRGWGEVDDSVRRGVSACYTIDSLYRYFADRGADLDDCVLVEMDADIAADEDWDAQRGAVLVYPRRIVSVTPLDPAEVMAAC